jgi:methyltransferase (TIGR00027 family)
MKDDAPSATAAVVAKSVLLVAATPALAHLVSPFAADLTARFLAAAVPDGADFFQRVRRSWYRAFLHFLLRVTIPGLALHQALRKRRIEEIVRRSLAEGFEQVVVLGGGFDSLALRLAPEFPLATFLELDHPATQRVKAEVVAANRLAAPNLIFAPVDLARTRLEEFLSGAPEYRSGRDTLFLCEGVLMYLAPPEVDALFAALARQSAPRVRFLFTAMEPDARGRPAFRNSTWFARRWLERKQEPFLWGLARADVAAFLSSRGFSLAELAVETDFRSRYLPGALSRHSLAEGEILILAAR